MSLALPLALTLGLRTPALPTSGAHELRGSGGRRQRRRIDAVRQLMHVLVTWAAKVQLMSGHQMLTLQCTDHRRTPPIGAASRCGATLRPSRLTQPVHLPMS